MGVGVVGSGVGDVGVAEPEFPVLPAVGWGEFVLVQLTTTVAVTRARTAKSARSSFRTWRSRLHRLGVFAGSAADPP